MAPLVALRRCEQIHQLVSAYHLMGEQSSFYTSPVCHCLNASRAPGAGRSSEVRAYAHGAMGRRIDPSWGGPIELFLVPASAPRLV